MLWASSRFSSRRRQRGAPAPREAPKWAGCVIGISSEANSPAAGGEAGKRRQTTPAAKKRASVSMISELALAGRSTLTGNMQRLKNNLIAHAQMSCPGLPLLCCFVHRRWASPGSLQRHSPFPGIPRVRCVPRIRRASSMHINRGPTSGNRWSSRGSSALLLRNS